MPDNVPALLNQFTTDELTRVVVKRCSDKLAADHLAGERLIADITCRLKVETRLLASAEIHARKVREREEARKLRAEEKFKREHVRPEGVTCRCVVCPVKGGSF